MQWQIIYKDTTQSTNVDAYELARDGAPSGTVIVAREQRAGKGQWNRVWVSPRGGLYFSCILRPALDQCLWSSLSPLIAKAVQAGIEHACDISHDVMSIKEPNDVVCTAGKLSGILLKGLDGTTIIVGCGVNVVRPEREIVTDGRNVAAYLEDFATDVDGSPECLDRILLSILDEISHIAYE